MSHTYGPGRCRHGVEHEYRCDQCATFGTDLQLQTRQDQQPLTPERVAAVMANTCNHTNLVAGVADSCTVCDPDDPEVDA